MVVTGLKARGCTGESLEKDNVRSLELSESRLFYMLADAVYLSEFASECELNMNVFRLREVREMICSLYIT